jgi:C4-dicarboxylate-specific signal transduction histidine kinase
LFPAVISFFLAEDFALNQYAVTTKKLEEVNILSEKNLSIEKEKQEILASQNQQLEMQVKQRTSELSKSLEELKAAQSQLIQSEKMASLGELTAGIAHEIQNPLNFVNNFSEVNMELSEEIMEAVKKGELDTINKLANDIKSNQAKILEHGQRADGIVKSIVATFAQ